MKGATPKWKTTFFILMFLCTLLHARYFDAKDDLAMLKARDIGAAATGIPSR
jgi:hypothetical protein